MLRHLRSRWATLDMVRQTDYASVRPNVLTGQDGRCGNKSRLHHDTMVDVGWPSPSGTSQIESWGRLAKFLAVILPSCSVALQNAPIRRSYHIVTTCKTTRAKLASTTFRAAHQYAFGKRVGATKSGHIRFFAQLVLEVRSELNFKPIDYSVGTDIGPNTIAVVGGEDTFMDGVCDELERLGRKIGRVQLRMDHSVQVMNQDIYNQDGTIRLRRKTWKFTSCYLQDKRYLSKLCRKRVATSKKLHGRLVDRIFRRFEKKTGVRALKMFME